MKEEVKEYLMEFSFYRYSWEAAGGDDPSKRKRDAKQINRSEGYEVLGVIVAVLKTLGLEATNPNIFNVEYEIQASKTRNRQALIDELVEALGQES